MNCLTPSRPTLLRSRALWLHHMLSVVSDGAHFDMQTFVQQREPEKGTRFRNAFASYIGITASWPWCSTAGCIGGHIIMLGFTPEERDTPRMRYASFTEEAAKWLGLDRSETTTDLAIAMFSPGYNLDKITRQQAVDVVHTLYEDGVWYWKAVAGMEDFDYSYKLRDEHGDRGDLIPVDWRPEPDRIIGDLFALRDRIKRSYWNGNGEQPWPNSLDDDTPVCLLTGAGAVRRDQMHYGDVQELYDALRAATPNNTNFVTISDSGLDHAVALIDKAILIRLGVLPTLRPDLG